MVIAWNAVEKYLCKYLVGNPLYGGERLESDCGLSFTYILCSVEVQKPLMMTWFRVASAESYEIRYNCLEDFAHVELFPKVHESMGRRSNVLLSDDLWTIIKSGYVT